MQGGSERAGSLDALVSGKRRVPRRAVALPVCVKAVQASFTGEAHDLSTDGALLSMPLAQLAEGHAGPLGPAEQFALLERHFRDTFDLQFEGRDVVVEAQVVRLLVGAGDEDRLSVGCRFVEPLGEEPQRRLGLLEAEAALPSWGEATLAHPLTHAADPSRPVTALLLDEHAAHAGPRHVAPVAAVGPDALLVRVHAGSTAAAHAALGDGPLEVRLVRGRRPLFATSACLGALRYVDSPAPGAEALLVLPAPLPRGVRRLFRRS